MQLHVRSSVGGVAGVLELQYGLAERRVGTECRARWSAYKYESKLPGPEAAVAEVHLDLAGRRQLLLRMPLQDLTAIRPHPACVPELHHSMHNSAIAAERTDGSSRRPSRVALWHFVFAS